MTAREEMRELARECFAAAAELRAHEQVDALTERELTPLQRESAEVNELSGVIAFCAGAFAEIMRCATITDARTCAELAMQSIRERASGQWRPGPHDDPANWRAR